MVFDACAASLHRYGSAPAGIETSMAMRGATDLRDGCFDKDPMIDLAQEMLEAGTRQGFALTRIIAVSR